MARNHWHYRFSLIAISIIMPAGRRYGVPFGIHRLLCRGHRRLRAWRRIILLLRRTVVASIIDEAMPASSFTRHAALALMAAKPRAASRAMRRLSARISMRGSSVRANERALLAMQTIRRSASVAARGREIRPRPFRRMVSTAEDVDTPTLSQYRRVAAIEAAWPSRPT